MLFVVFHAQMPQFTQTPRGRIHQKVDPPILDSNTPLPIDYRTKRWIYFLDPPRSGYEVFGLVDAQGKASLPKAP